MKRKLPFLLVVLLALGLLFGGQVHSSLHAEDSGDCSFCQIVPQLTLGDPPVVAAPVLLEVLPESRTEFLLDLERQFSSTPRAPPVHSFDISASTPA